MQWPGISGPVFILKSEAVSPVSQAGLEFNLLLR